MFHIECVNSESDKRIIERAAGVLADGHGRTMQEIAEKSGIGRTTLYRRFRTREDLLRAILEEAIAEATIGIEAARPEEGDPREALRRVIEELLKIGDKYRVLFQEKTAHTEHVESKEQFVEALRELVRRAQREGAIDPTLPIDWVTGAMGAMVATASRLIASGDIARNHAADLVLRTLLDGVGQLEPDIS